MGRALDRADEYKPLFIGTWFSRFIQNQKVAIWLQYILQKLKNILTNDYKECIIKS